MRGPNPKSPELRQRRNKASTAAVLTEQDGELLKVPPLPRTLFPGGLVHRLTRRWWQVVWRSPMAPHWIEADIEGLYLVAILRNEFFFRPSTTLAAEIRQQESRFGLTPMDRRRLDWRLEEPARKKPFEPEARAPEEETDPREVLRLVQ